MTASQNNLISVTDYNAIRNIAASVMGVGSASRGYGQVINSIAKNQNQLVSQTDWDNLRFDLLNARIHQAGTGSLQEINEAETIGASTINLYESLRTTIDNNRFAVADGQFLTNGFLANGTPLTTSRSYSGTTWKNEISCTLTVTFADSDRARYFFNSGGTIRITSTRSSGVRDDAQNISWNNLLRDFGGLREFGGSDISGNIANRNFYNLTSTFRSYYSVSSSSPYSANRYVLEARSDVANNTTGTASQVFIRIRFIDGYTDPPGGNPGQFPPEDGVDGTFTVSVSEKRADGIGMMLPSGNFTIQSPSSYSITTLTGN